MINVKDLIYDTEMKFYYNVACVLTELYLKREENIVLIKYTFNELR